MQFVHITDLHADAAAICGIDPFERLAQCCRHIRQYCPQAAFVVVTGDVANQGDVASYIRVRSELAELGKPVFLVPGNHDRPEVMRLVFMPRTSCGLVPGTWWAQKVITEYGDLIFLNSHMDGTDAGWLEAAELERLSKELMSDDQRSVLLFLHHPPFMSGIACMDCLALQNVRELLAVIRAGKRKVAGIFCGHLHRTIAGTWDGIPVWCMRSTCHQVDAREPGNPNMRCCVENPEYGVVTWDPPTLLSQSIQFTANGPSIVMGNGMPSIGIARPEPVISPIAQGAKVLARKVLPSRQK